MVVLLFSNFPPPGSTLIEKHEEQGEVQNDDSPGEPLLNDRD